LFIKIELEIILAFIDRAIELQYNMYKVQFDRIH